MPISPCFGVVKLMTSAADIFPAAQFVFLVADMADMVAHEIMGAVGIAVLDQGVEWPVRGENAFDNAVMGSGIIGRPNDIGQPLKLQEQRPVVGRIGDGLRCLLLQARHG